MMTNIFFVVIVLLSLFCCLNGQNSFTNYGAEPIEERVHLHSASATGIGGKGTELLPIRIGFMLPYNSTAMKSTIAYVTTASAVVIALDRIYREHLLDYVDWQFFWQFPECNEHLAGGVASRFFTDSKVDVIIGPPCSTAAGVTGILGHYYNIPVVSWAATDPRLSDRKRFPTIARTIGSSKQLGNGLMMMLKAFAWAEVALMYNDDTKTRKCYFVHLGFEEAQHEYQQSGEFTVLVRHQVAIYGDSPSDSDINNFLLAVKETARIVIACLDKAEDRRRLMLAVRRLEMDTNEFVYILPDYFVDAKQNNIWQHPGGENADGMDSEAEAAFHKAFVMEMQLEETPELDNFKKQIPERMKLSPFNYKPAKDEQYGSVYSPFMHDAMYLYALALNNTLVDAIRDGANVTEKKRDGRAIVNNCINRTFHGASGEVVMDSRASRLPDFVLKAFTLDGTYQPVAFFHMFKPPEEIVELALPDEDFWATRGGQAPLSRPKCGWKGELCVETPIRTVATMAAFIAATALLVIIYIIKRSRSQASQMNKLLWQIDRSELIKIDEEVKSKTSRSVNSRLSVNSDTSKGTSNSSALDSAISIRLKKTHSHTFYYYKGAPCAVKQHPQPYPFKHESDQREIRVMRSLNHANVNIFLGLCLNGSDAWSVWRFCSRGSLQDVFEKDTIRLDWFFKFSLINDCAQGLDYLFNSSIGSHGFLTSKTCVIDDRWRLKLTEYGISPLKALTENYPSASLWTAPELLRTGVASLPLGTKEGDIYSLGIIISETLLKQRAFKNEGLSYEEIVYRVKKGENPPYRPSVDDLVIDDPQIHKMLQLMRECWDELPESRPDMKTIKVALKSMMKGRETNLMDHVLNMMERYAGSLEAQIGERTKQLIEEQKKSDLLLNRMLPKAVADVLKAGGHVEPESFSAATIFFSDVVGFTVIAGQSSPMQVVGLLNDLYSLFDAVIEQHDAYKMETIGDAYLVVSGVPRRNGDAHASEIANLALGFNRAIASFVVAHLPAQRVQLRIGLNTGPVVAGVVGLSMPRYCLFGDAVNIAAKMESHGKPGQIQMTVDTNKYLTSVIGGYVTECRGEVLIKGKGTMTTYWLLKKEEHKD